MLTFMNSKLTKMTGKDKQNHIFQKSKPYEISSKKTSDLIKDISGHDICSRIKIQQVRKDHLSLSAKNFSFFLELLYSILSSHF